MQNDPQPFVPSGLMAGTPEAAFHRAHARAPAPPGTTAAPTACPVLRSESTDELDPHVEPLLGGADLLRAAREPVEWLLTLAHRLASGEPEETAAVDRMRAAFHSMLAGRAIGVRMSDVLIVFALLVGALDPAIVHHAVARTIADGVATLLTYEGVSLAARLAHIANSLPATVHHAQHRRARTPRSTPL